jgi:hypothetical protein
MHCVSDSSYWQQISKNIPRNTIPSAAESR